MKKTATKAPAKKTVRRKKSAASSAANVRLKALQASVRELKKEIKKLKAEAVAAARHVEMHGMLTNKRTAAIAKFVSSWDKKVHTAIDKKIKAVKKKF